jgi:two-component system, NarL family, response regulator LiaR
MSSTNRKSKSSPRQVSCNPLKPVTILLAQGQSVIHAGVRSLIQDISGIRIVAETDKGAEVLQLIAAKYPDIVLIDSALSGFNGLELVAKIKADFPHIRIIILSLDENTQSVCQALRAGASAYILSDVDIDELCLAIRSAMRGSIYVGASVSQPAFTEILFREPGIPETPDLGNSSLESLTPRHREILQLMVEGLSLKKIAQSLRLSIKTVEAHKRQIMERLGIQNIADFVRYAIRSGIINEKLKQKK